MSSDLFAPLEPDLDLLRREYVLVQAWKKTAAYIRYHNWFSDTLELDWTAINLPSFLAEISERMESPESWENRPLRLIPAPKSQDWTATQSGWRPSTENLNVTSRLRPLAHVDLRDQVAATALMLGLANQVETKQGDSRKDIENRENRRCVVSYGNRLFCDECDGHLFHRWGSQKLYRSYYQDYRHFVSRPEVVAQSVKNGRRAFIVHLDLSKFYDRVRPELLAAALEDLRDDDDDDDFFTFAKKLLCWNWDLRDEKDVEMYAKQSDVEGFSEIALPQGLVASGFFANVVLLPFDNKIREKMGSEVQPGILLEDVCRYVDDFRVVVSAEDSQNTLQDIGLIVSNWLASEINAVAPALQFNKDKTESVEFGGNQNILVRQSAKMRRIQSAVSGGFDAVGGLEILDKIQGLTRQAEQLKSGDALSPFALIADVRDATVMRFAAGRFRATYRSLRPLLEETFDILSSDGSRSIEDDPPPRIRSRAELDEDAKAFAFDLVGRWAKDPSNVRLLRIGLDLWPDPEMLQKVLNLLDPLITDTQRQPRAKRQIAWYCLSELFRAGATETGMAEDEQSLPDGVDLTEYRNTLSQKALEIVGMPGRRIPWYLRQQALLFLAVHSPENAIGLPVRHSAETIRYHKLLAYLNGSSKRISNPDFATFAVLARCSFLNAQHSVGLARKGMESTSRKVQIATRNPSFMLELGKDQGKDYFRDLPRYIREDLCADVKSHSGSLQNLANIVLNEIPQEVLQLRNELSLLHFSNKLLRKLEQKRARPLVVTPSDVWLKLKRGPHCTEIEELQIESNRSRSSKSQYRPPSWVAREDHWRFHLGFLLRFILSQKPDFTQQAMPTYWREEIAAYRPAVSHWYQRRYGLFSGQPAFGDDWVPITGWFEYFLTALLAWPGCQIRQEFRWVHDGPTIVQNKIRKRIEELEEKRESSTGTLLMPMCMDWEEANLKSDQLRVCIVQTVIPEGDDFKNHDLTLSKPETRRRHRNHLSAALAAIESMLNLRATHKENGEQLDWLILPELAVHPADVRTHLVPFARKHKTLILAGLAYEELLPDHKLVNSALWIMPERSVEGSWHTRTRRQCKSNLAPDEQKLSPQLIGYRPCQWLLGYPWSTKGTRKIWLTASICYDATDLALTTKLRNESDVFAIPALNKDVDTFDRMALALHYHMFQLVIVANNGTYGGSNAYMPVRCHHERQVFHLHGQTQASVAFLEIQTADLAKRGENSSSKKWKNPPAGWEE